MNNVGSITLLHASDFHMRKDETDPLLRQSDIRSFFVHDAEQLAIEIGSPSALVFSGDIAFGGKAEEYIVARKMLTDILTRLNLKDQRIFVIPGNHDVDRDKTVDLKARMLRDQLRSNDDPEAEKIFVKKRFELLEPLSAFQEFAMPYDCLIMGEKGYWEIGNDSNSSASQYLAADFNFHIRGISTVHASDRNDGQAESLEDLRDEGSHMYVAQGQLSCEPLTSESPFRVLVGHHPPPWWRFSKDRITLANARYHLHLFGHEHQFSPKPSENAICVNAGAVNPDDSNAEQARYNWINIKKCDDGYLVRIWSRVFDNNQMKFIEDTEWPGGQGYLIDPILRVKPILIEPEILSESSPIPPAPIIPVDAHEEEMIKAHDSTTTQTEDKKQLSPHAVRFALFSQGHLRYSLIFKSLGYEPSGMEKETLGGLEYYEEILEELLLPENIGKLIAAMSETEIDIS